MSSLSSYTETYSSQLLTYYNEHTKLVSDKSPAIFVILKDQFNDITEDISLSSIFSLNKKNVYVTSKVIKQDYNEKQLQYILDKMKEITANANSKYNKWIELKLDEEVIKWKPSFLILWYNYIEPTMKSTQGTNSCIGQMYTDYIWFPIVFIFVGIICLLSYPCMYIYDFITGRSRKLHNIIQTKIKNDDYQYTTQINLYIFEALKCLSSEIKVPNVNIESGYLLYDYIIVESGVDGDSILKHTADRFILQFIYSNHNNDNNNHNNHNNDIIVSINENISIVNNNNNNNNNDNNDNSKYSKLITDEV